MGDNRSERDANVCNHDDAPDQSPKQEVDMAPAKSSKSPAFQFFPRDFLASPKVDRMAMTERGAYITLLCRCWLDNGLPTDMGELAYYCRMKPAQFERMWTSGRISQCFTERGGKFHNERLDVERKKQAANRQRQSDNAKSGWQRRGSASDMPPHKSGIARAHAPVADAISNQQSADSEGGGSGEDGQAAFMRFQSRYPESRRKGGRIVMGEFEESLALAGSSGVLFAALENHLASEQWSNPQLIPGMDVWLREQRWRQVLVPKNSGTQAPKTPWEPLSVTLARAAKAQQS